MKNHTQAQVTELLNDYKRALDEELAPLESAARAMGWKALSNEEMGRKDGLMRAMSIASDFQEEIARGLR